MVMTVQQDIVPGQGLADAKEKAGIRVLVNQRIVGLIRAKPVIIHLARPVMIIQHGVEYTIAAGVPDSAAGGFLNMVKHVFAAAQIAHIQPVFFRSCGIGRPGQFAVVRGVTGTAQPEIGQTLGFHIGVQQDALLTAITRCAHQKRMLCAGQFPRQIGISAIGRWHRTVIFLDAAAHFIKQRLLQCLGIRHGRLGIGILSFQMRPDVGGQKRRVAHHFLPVVVPQPAVSIFGFNAMMGV